MNYKTLDDLPWEDLGGGWETATVNLDSGDFAVNPSSTKGDLCGPATVTYNKGPSGSIQTILVPKR